MCMCVCVVHSSCDDRSSKKKKKKKENQCYDIFVEQFKKEKMISLIEKNTCHRNFKHT